MNNYRTIVIDNHKAVSWNKFYEQRHWSKRNRTANEIQMLVWGLCAKQKVKPVTFRVDIDVQAFTKGQRGRLDSDNICAKLYVDGLKKANIIKDDDPRYVRYTNTVSIPGSDSNVVIIQLSNVVGRPEPWEV